MVLKCLPCLDSDGMSEGRRRELDISRDLARNLGHSALEAARAGFYVSDDGNHVDWSRLVQEAQRGKVSIAPNQLLPQTRPRQFVKTWVQVTNESTLGASRRLVESGHKPMALNFANGIHAGGGFLSGARAQEEVLCRSSALFQTITGDIMYKEHRQRPQPDSTAWAIFSPDVPVFRTDDGTTLEHPWLLNILTCAAPYAPAIGQPESGDLLHARIRRVLAIAEAYRFSALVLGAWGCGAFKNDIRRTAEDFKTTLEEEYSGAFSDVVFAITDWSSERRFLGPFREVFADD